jgi:hypothetical protein
MLPPPGQKTGEAASVVVDANHSVRGFKAPAVAMDDNPITLNQQAVDCK